MGKELLTDLKYGIFKNWLRTRPKMETNEPNVYPTILGGVSRGFWGPFEALGARSAIFWHLKTGTFADSREPGGKKNQDTGDIFFISTSLTRYPLQTMDGVLIATFCISSPT